MLQEVSGIDFHGFPMVSRWLGAELAVLPAAHGKKNSFCRGCGRLSLGSLGTHSEYGRNLESKVSYKVLNVEAMKDNVEELREETAVIIYNLLMEPCAQMCPKNTATNLIKPKMWPLCKQGMAGSMDDPGHPWTSRNGRRAIRGSVDGLDPPLAPNKVVPGVI